MCSCVCVCVCVCGTSFYFSNCAVGRVCAVNDPPSAAPSVNAVTVCWQFHRRAGMLVCITGYHWLLVSLRLSQD